jgi:hypothetical protein
MIEQSERGGKAQGVLITVKLSDLFYMQNLDPIALWRKNEATGETQVTILDGRSAKPYAFEELKRIHSGKRHSSNRRISGTKDFRTLGRPDQMLSRTSGECCPNQAGHEQMP